MIPNTSDSEGVGVDRQNGSFICGVVEGFYGKPWTTDQRRRLFHRMKVMGMNSYLYAPKDDCKHRMYWRDMYSVEEADHLTGLIEAANESGANFIYAISPGLDIQFSSTKDVALLKKKLEQVASFGCKAFALLFDDIEVDMCESDKEIFLSFAHAQCSVTNEVYQHLGQPSTFLFCPTEYCASRAVPTVPNSEYLSTIGSKLLPGIDILWTGPKVISKRITVKSIEEVSAVLKRPPVIWDNIHANDYDVKRLFLGPFEGRASELIPYLKGVLTNPNCEFEGNFIAMHTLAQWSRSNINGMKQRGDLLPSDSPLRADIKLETEGDYSSDEDFPVGCHSAYQPRQALSVAMNDWLQEFVCDIKPASKTIAKPVALAPTDIVAPATVAANINEMQQNLEVNESFIQPAMSTLPLNSLLDSSSDSESDTSCSEPLEPMDCLVTPGSSPVTTDSLLNGPPPSIIEINTANEAQSAKLDTVGDHMQVDPESLSQSAPSTVSMQNIDNRPFTYEELQLLVDMFYMPFEHGSNAVAMLNEFVWLKSNSHSVFDSKLETASPEQKHSAMEWQERAQKLSTVISDYHRMMKNFCEIPNQALTWDLFPYVWDMKAILTILQGFLAWLECGHVPYLSVYYMQASPYTWTNKLYQDAFVSGDQEPWVFRGGLQAEFQRLMPLEGAVDLLVPTPPPFPSHKMFLIRPYKPQDKDRVYSVCLRTCDDGKDGTELFPSYPELIADKLIGAFLELSADYCFVVEDEEMGVIGYVVAAIDTKQFHQNIQDKWLPTLQQKYPVSDVSSFVTPIQDVVRSLYTENYLPETLTTAFPSVVRMGLLPECNADPSVARRSLAVEVCALKCNGSHGMYVTIPSQDKHIMDYYSKLGMSEVTALDKCPPDVVHMGRTI